MVYKLTSVVYFTFYVSFYNISTIINNSLCFICMKEKFILYHSFYTIVYNINFWIHKINILRKIYKSEPECPYATELFL